MRCRFKLGAVIVVVGLFAFNAVYAASGKASSLAPGKAIVFVDAGNKLCPISGAKVDGKTFFHYNGKRYGMCCPKCYMEFKRNPMKYASIADKEVAGK